MIYFFINVLMYLVMMLLLCKYFSYRMNIYSFLIIMFNLNISFIFVYLDINFIYGLLCMLISVLLYYFVNLFNKNNRDIILIKDGNINFHELINNYSYSKLVNYLKIKNIKLDEVAYLIKRNNNLVLIKNKEINGYPISLIVDGNLMENNLKLIHKNREWLRDELLNNHLLIKNVDYAYYKKDKIYFISN